MSAWRSPRTTRSSRQSPLYREEFGQRCIAYDPEAAEPAARRARPRPPRRRGVRLLPDGRPMELTVETAGEDTEQVDVLELVRDEWREIGFVIHAKPSDRETLRNRVFAGDALMTIFYGIDNGMPTAAMPPRDFAPTSQADQPQWPKWGQYYETKGAAGEPPDLPEAQAADGAVRRVAEQLRARAPGGDLGRDARPLHQPVLHAGPGPGGAPATGGARQTCATCPRRRSSTGSRRARSASTGRTRSSTPSEAGREPSGAGSFSSHRLLSKAPGDSGSWPITPLARRSAWRVAR